MKTEHTLLRPSFHETQESFPSLDSRTEESTTALNMCEPMLKNALEIVGGCPKKQSIVY